MQRAKWIALGAALALALLAPRSAHAAALNIDFCERFNALTNAPLITLLPDDIAVFIGFFNPDTADINGSFDIDDSGDNLQIVLNGNDIPDATNEFKLLATILADANFDNGVLTHTAVRAAWDNNLAQIQADMGVDLATLVAGGLPGLLEILTAYHTIGGGEFTVVSGTQEGEKIVVFGNGSFGFVGALFALLNNALVSNDLPALANPNIDENAYISFPALRFDGDADGDGFSNICEFRAFTPNRCGAQQDPGQLYVAAALNENIVPDGCLEAEADCVVVLSSANIVPPIVTEDATGSVRLRQFRNDSTGEVRYRLDIFHTVPYPGVAEIRAGAEGVNGDLLIALGPAAPPISYELSLLEAQLIAEQDAYLVITSVDYVAQDPNDNRPGFPDGELRAQLVCEGIDTSEWVPLTECGPAVLNADNLVPALESPHPRVGEVVVSTWRSSQTGIESMVFDLAHDILAVDRVEVFAGNPGEVGTLLFRMNKASTLFSYQLSAAEKAAVEGSVNVYVTLYRNLNNVPNFPWMRANLNLATDCEEVEVGEGEGEGEGTPEGEGEGTPEGEGEGTPEGEGEGTPEGEGEGTPEGEGEGTPEGEGEGTPEGEGEGTPEGEGEGTPEGEGEGTPEGEGATEGEDDGIHSADQNGDGRVNLSELLRVIQFFNSTRYGCEQGTEDGFVPNGLDETCAPHSSDYNPQDWRITLTELLRLIQFFNAAGYEACPAPPSEDGYCPVF